MEVDADRFAASMESLLGGVAHDLEGAIKPAVKASATRARREIRQSAKSLFEVKNGKYAKGWSYRVKRVEDGYAAEVGNRDVPGLPHLLEKGHAKVGGGRVAGREHIAPAADDAFDEFERMIGKAVNDL